MNIEKICNTPEETEAFAAVIGSRLKGGECIELTSDIGGGKTTFTRGLAAGAGSKDQVSSPTFTISKQYRAGDVTLYHFDFYRLQEAGVVAEELAEARDDSSAVVIVEWADSVVHVLPEQRVRIDIQKTATSIDQRKLTFSVPEKLEYLFDEETK